MAGSLTSLGHTSAQPFIEAEVYSQFILENLPDVLLPEGMWRDVSDFGSGTTLNIKTVGSVTLQEAAEDVPLVYNPIDTGAVTLTITDYVGDAWRVTDDLREDGAQIDTLMGMRAMESTRALGEHHETRFLSTAGTALGVTTSLGLVNGRPHRWVAGNGTTRLMEFKDFVAMKLAFDKANVPQMGRIAIVDPIVEATINSLVLTTTTIQNSNPQFEGLVTEGFAKSHRFVRNIMGFDIYTSNFLPTLSAASGTIDASAYGLANDAAEAGDIANVFMCIADDGCKPIMHAWRRMPKTEGWRDEETRSDKFQVTSRFGFGAQRLDTLGVIYTDFDAY